MLNAYLSDGLVEIPLYAANAARDELQKLGLYIPPDFAKANSFNNVAGREPSKGWVLVKRSGLNSLNLNTTLNLRFTFDSVTMRFYELVITKEPINLFPSITANHTDAIYLVELADSRWRVHNPYYVQAISKLYNVSSNATLGSGGPLVLLSASMNGGSAWTWSEMVSDIWGLMSGKLGTFPGLPFVPHGTPYGWIFQGQSAWDALCDVLDRIGCVVRGDLSTATSQYTIVQAGGADAVADAAVDAAILARRKTHDGEYLSLGRRAPQYIRVFFHKVRSAPTMIPPFLENSVYTVDVATGVSGAESGVYHPIWDDLQALLDGSGTVTNTAALDIRAAERASDYVRSTITGSERSWRRFIGLWNIQPGAKFQSVVWTANGAGITTDVMEFPPTPVSEQCCVTQDYANAGTVQDLVRLGFPSQPLAIGAGVGGGAANGILYVDASLTLSQDETKLYYNESSSTFGVVNNAYFDIKNSKTFIVEETTTNNLYFKIDNSTHQINIWENTLIINEGLVKIDISIVNQQFFVWDQTNYYIKIDDSTQLVTFWNAFITISSTVFKITTGGSDFFYADTSDKSIKIGWPSKATNDTEKYAYWHYVGGKPTGAVPSKSGYWAWLWDSTNYRSWFYAQSVSKWLLECCWIIVKKSSNYTAEYGDFIWGDTSGGGVDIDLPSPLLNQEIKIRTDTLLNPLRVTGTGIGTNVPLTLQNMTYDFYSDGSNWYTDDVDPSMPEGTATGDMLVWNESNNKWQILDAPTVDGYVLTSDSGKTLGMKWAPSCCYTPFTITYNADDTFTPDFTGYVKVEVWGAGGGGYGDVTKGGGGGGGAYAKLNSYAVTSGNSYTVNVGAAGGDDSFFVDSSTVMAKSAVDATTASGTAGGSAGSSVGDVKFSGGSGANASGADTGGGGGGSAGDAGNGGNASTITGGTAGTAGGGAGGNGGTGGSSGANGSVPGGGGGGNSLSAPPGNGGHGRVIITRIS